MRAAMSQLVRPVRRLIGATCVAYALKVGIGDALMLTTVAHELKRRGRRRDLRHRRISRDLRGEHRLRRRGHPRIRAWPDLLVSLATDHPMAADLPDQLRPDHRGARPRRPSPILAYMCRMAGVTGRVNLRPYVTLTESGTRRALPIAAASPSRAAASGAESSFPEQGVVPRAVRRGRRPPDPVPSRRPDRQPRRPARAPVRTTCAAGLSLRQLAAVLSHRRLFVGLIGMPMHMARAVDCPSVIVYGGRERPDQTGYICNENLYNAGAMRPLLAGHAVRLRPGLPGDDPGRGGDRGRRADA